MIRWFAKNDYAANFLMVAILVSGLYAIWFKIPTEVTPSKKLDYVVVDIPFPGGTPIEVEQKIVIPAENALNGLNNIKSISSNAWRSRGRIRCEVKEGDDIEKLKTDIESRIDTISTFPTESENPNIFIPDTAHWKPVISVVVSGDMSEKDLIAAAREVRDDLLTLSHVSKCDVVGVRNSQINIEVHPDTLLQYGLTLNDVSNAIQENSIDLSAGTISTESGRVMLRTTSQALDQEQFENIIIIRKNGAEIKLRDIASVKDNFDEQRKVTRHNGERAVMLQIVRQPSDSSLKISAQVHEYVKNSKNSAPKGVTLHAWNDDSVSLQGRISTLFWNLLQGCILVFILLSIFLRVSLAFWVVVGIPVSFAGAFLLMPTLGVTANIMSLFGFIIVLGLVVDDAIVTSEHIFTKLKLGMTPLEASITGAKEIAVPVTFGVLTTMIAFVPLAYQTGRLGALAEQIPYVVIPVLLFSLIESKLILPSHLKHIKVNREDRGFFTFIQKRATLGLEWFVAVFYKPLLITSVRYRYITLTLFTTIGLITFGYLGSGKMGFQAAPNVDRYFIFARLSMNEGTSFEKTSEVIADITSKAYELKETFTDGANGEPLIGDVMSFVGGWPSWGRTNDNLGFVLVEILPPGSRQYPGPKNQVIADAWTESVGEIPGMESFVIRSERSGDDESQERDDIELEVRGKTDETMLPIALEIERILEETTGVKSANAETSSPQNEFQISLLPYGRDLGLTQQNLARQIRGAFHGEEAQRIQREEENVKVMVRLPDAQRESLYTLKNLQISLPNGSTTHLDNVAKITKGTSPQGITRKDGARVYYISAVPETNDTNISDIGKTITPIFNEITSGTPGVNWRFRGTLAEDAENKTRLWFTGAVMLFALYALLAIPFRSLTQPIFVLLAIPFGAIGAILGHIIMDITPSFLSVFGIIALAGIVINDALVMVDFTNLKRRQCGDAYEAVIDSGASRFRPIMLTSVTTFAGLMPLIFERSIQAQFLIPMAVSVAFGILFATFITLFLIPCAYMATEDLKSTFSKIVSWYTKPFKKTPE